MTGVNAGTTTVRVSSADNSINASCTVYVKIPDGVYYIKNAAVSKYLQNSGADAGVAAKDTSAETKYSQLWKITYVANGRYVIRPMDNTSKALTIGTSGYISVANATSNNAALSSSYLWSIGRDSDGIYFQQNGVSSKTITTYITNTTIIVYPNTYNTNTFCHWTLEEVKGIFLRDTETSEIITPNTVKYIELGESLSYSQLGINYEYYGSLIGGLTWLSSSSSIAGVGYYTGAVIGNSPGLATITLKANINGTYYSTSYCIYVKPISDGTYYIRNWSTDKYVDIENQTLTTGTRINQWTFDKSRYQQWVFTHVKDSIYTIHSANSGTKYYLGVRDDSSAENQAIVLRTGAITDGMKWELILTDYGAYKFIPICGSSYNYVLSTSTSSVSAGATLVQARYTDTSSYKDAWFILGISKSYTHVTIKNESSISTATVHRNIADYYSINAKVPGSIYSSITEEAFVRRITTSNYSFIITHGGESKNKLYISLSEELCQSEIEDIPMSSFDDVQLIVLAACYSARSNDISLVDSLRAKGVDNVIGFSDEIEQKITMHWSQEFAKYLSLGYSIGDALMSAQRALETQYIGTNYETPMNEFLSCMDFDGVDTSTVLFPQN